MKQILLLFISLVIFCHSCSAPLNPYAEVEAEFDTYAEQGTMVTNIDTHGGFLGDGDAFVKVEYDAEAGREIQKKLSNDEDWGSLPLTDDLKRVAGCCRYEFPRSRENGYYYFYDRSRESENPKDASPVMHRYSYNFTLGIYDSEENALYWFEFDT